MDVACTVGKDNPCQNVNHDFCTMEIEITILLHDSASLSLSFKPNTFTAIANNKICAVYKELSTSL